MLCLPFLSFQPRYLAWLPSFRKAFDRPTKTSWLCVWIYQHPCGLFHTAAGKKMPTNFWELLSSLHILFPVLAVKTEFQQKTANISLAPLTTRI